MTASYLIVRRRPYEEPYHTELEFEASNGQFSGCARFFCSVEDIGSIGRALVAFPTNANDTYQYAYGSDDPEDKFGHYFCLKFYTVGSLGHCAIQFRANLNSAEPDEGVCTFSIKAEPAAIHRLGLLFLTFGRLEHLELHWSPTGGGELYKGHR